MEEEGAVRRGAVGGGCLPVRAASAVTGARTHGGELITHVISS